MQTLLMLIFLVSIVLIIYSWKKAKTIINENPENIETNEDYKKFSKIKKKAIIGCISSVLLLGLFGSSSEITPNDFAENIQTDEATLGITPEEFVKKYNSTINRLAKNNVDNLNIIRIDKYDLDKNNKNYKEIHFIQKDNNLNVYFKGIISGNKLVNVFYQRHNSFDNNFMLISESIMFSIPYTSRNMIKCFKSFFKNKDYLSKTFYKGDYAYDHFSENGIYISFGMMDDHKHNYTNSRYQFGIENENTIARMKREGILYD